MEAEETRRTVHATALGVGFSVRRRDGSKGRFHPGSLLGLSDMRRAWAAYKRRGKCSAEGRSALPAITTTWWMSPAHMLYKP